MGAAPPAGTERSVRTLGALDLAETRRRLAGPGLALRTGPFLTRVHSPLPDVAAAVHRLYASHAIEDGDAFVDFEVAVRRPRGLRRWWQPQVVFELEGAAPFNPLQGDQGFPLLEWGLNWCVYGLCHQYLIVHAAVLERGGRALLLPAPSGSGKSTLCAALLFNGWRLLSDELALVRPADGRLVPMPRPVSLKNASIDVIGRFVPDVRFGSRVSETSKGVVAHFAAPAEAVARADELAWPGWVVLPRYRPGSDTLLTPLPRARAFMHMVENAFNYDVLGLQGFETLGALIDRCECFSFEYSRLDEAVARFNALADGLPPRSG